MSVIILFVILTKDKPFTKDEIKKLREVFDIYIKIVIDINQKICSAGCNRHYESEKILLEQGSEQSDLWGGGIDIDSKIIDYNSFINIRPNDNNPSNEILDPKIRSEFERLMRYFFNEIYE